MKYININQKLNFKFCQVPRKILYTEPYKSILCPLSHLAYIFIKVLEDYIETVDYEIYYFYKKYYLSGLKDGIKLQEELK